MSATKQAAEAVTVTLDEIDKVIRRAFRAFRPRVEHSSWGRGEIVYVLTPDDDDPDSVINVQTSIFRGQTEARGEGEDSIRVVLFNTRTKRPIAQKQSRVHRTAGWKDNLRDRIESALALFEELSDERARHKQMLNVREEQQRQQEANPEAYKSERDRQIEMLESIQDADSRPGTGHPAFAEMLGKMQRFKNMQLSEKQLRWVQEVFEGRGRRRFASECCGGTGVRPDGQPCQCGGACMAATAGEYETVFTPDPEPEYETVFTPDPV